MKPVIFAVVGVFLYAAQGVLIERKLAEFSPFAIMLLFYAGVLTLAIPSFLIQKYSIGVSMPHGSEYLFVIACGLMLFIADYFYYSAYTSGGNLTAITTIVTMLPVAASLIKFVFGGGLPSFRQACGCILAIIAVMLVGKN